MKPISMCVNKETFVSEQRAMQNVFVFCYLYLFANLALSQMKTANETERDFK